MAREAPVQLLDVLAVRIPDVAPTVEALPTVPLRIHARFSRVEILAVASADDRVKIPTWGMARGTGCRGRLS